MSQYTGRQARIQHLQPCASPSRYPQGGVPAASSSLAQRRLFSSGKTCISRTRRHVSGGSGESGAETARSIRCCRVATFEQLTH
jgi:hypothetical protein